MDTVTAILLTQLPIAIAILVCAYVLHGMKKELIELLEKISERKQK